MLLSSLTTSLLAVSSLWTAVCAGSALGNAGSQVEKQAATITPKVFIVSMVC